MVAAAAVVFSIGMHSFTQKHLRFLQFVLHWQGWSWDVDVICWIASVLGGAAVLVPPLLRKPLKDNTTLGYIPSGGMRKISSVDIVATLSWNTGNNMYPPRIGGVGGSQSVLEALSSVVGVSMFLTLSLVIAGFELLLREQVWNMENIVMYNHRCNN